jgi:hypothetical protein
MRSIGALALRPGDECNIDGVSGIYQISENTICIEYYANKIVNGKVQRVVVLQWRWDRSAWIASQQLIARMFTEIVAMPATPIENSERVH